MSFPEIFMSGAPDYNPSDFTITCCLGGAPGANYCSTSVTPIGYFSPARFCITSGEFCISDGLGYRPYTCSTTITPGQSFILRNCVPTGCFDTTFTTSVCIGGNDGKSPTCSTWTLSARVIDTIPDPFSVCNFINVELNTFCCGSVYLSGFDTTYACPVACAAWICYPCASTTSCTSSQLTLCGPGYFLGYSARSAGAYGSVNYYCINVGGCVACGSITTITPSPMTAMAMTCVASNAWPGPANCWRVTDYATNRLLGLPAGCFDSSSIGPYAYGTGQYWTGWIDSGCFQQNTFFYDPYTSKWFFRHVGEGKVCDYCSENCTGVNWCVLCLFCCISTYCCPRGSSGGTITNYLNKMCSGIFAGRTGGGFQASSSRPGLPYIGDFTSCYIQGGNSNNCGPYSCGVVSFGTKGLNSGSWCFCIDPGPDICCYNILQKLYTSSTCKVTRIDNLTRGGPGYIGLGVYCSCSCLCVSGITDTFSPYGCFTGFTGCAENCFYYKLTQIYIIYSCDGINWSKTPTKIFVCSYTGFNDFGSSVHPNIGIGRTGDGNYYIVTNQGYPGSSGIAFHVKCNCTCFAYPYFCCAGDATVSIESCSAGAFNSGLIMIGSDLSNPCYCIVANSRPFMSRLTYGVYERCCGTSSSAGSVWCAHSYTNGPTIYYCGASGADFWEAAYMTSANTVTYVCRQKSSCNPGFYYSGIDCVLWKVEDNGCYSKLSSACFNATVTCSFCVPESSYTNCTPYGCCACICRLVIIR